jgi:hypothetical protein
MCWTARLAGLIHHAPYRLRVGQIGLDHRVPPARQPRKYLGGESGRMAIMDGDPVTLGRERLSDGPADAPGRAGDQNCPPAHLTSLPLC